MYEKSIEIDPDWSEDTIAVQAGRPARTSGAPMSKPVTFSSTYVHSSELVYGRDGNESWGALEEALGALDGGSATIFPSGLAAATAIADLVPIGGKILIPRAAYYGVKNIFGRLESSGRLSVQLVDGGDTDAVIAALPGMDFVWMESIANPTLVVADVERICKAARKLNVISVVDATFATPLRQKPIALGADIVMQSATKFIGGHSDLLLGAVICASSEHTEFMRKHRHDYGAICSPLDAFLALRGLRTLAVRLEKSESNALELAKRLSTHPKITKVNYPALPDNSQYEKAKRVLPDGCGGMLSFEIDASPEQTDSMLADLKLITHATSLGGVESLIERRARYEAESTAGVPATLCRFSVGIENVEDLWRDLTTAIERNII